MRIWSLLVHCPGSIPIACSRALLEQEPSLDQRIPGVGMVARILFGFGGLDVNVPLEAQERHARALEAPGAERSEEQTSELQSLMRISYDVLYLKQKQQQE